MDDNFLARLQCPISKSRLAEADNDLLDSVNALIEKRELVDNGGNPIEEPLDSALVNDARTFAYPMQDGIPTMIAERAIPMDQINLDKNDKHA